MQAALNVVGGPNGTRWIQHIHVDALHTSQSLHVSIVSGMEGISTDSLHCVSV